MAIQRYYVNGDMTALKNALIASNFFGDCAIEVDIDWDNYTTVHIVDEFTPGGDTEAVYVRADSTAGTNMYRLYTYDGSEYIPSITTVHNSSNVTVKTRPATVTIKDGNGNLLFKIYRESCTTNEVIGSVTWFTYAANNQSIMSSSGIYSQRANSASIAYVYSCKNGVILLIENSGGSTPIRIVKTNNGKYAFISNRNTSTVAPSTPTGYPSGSGGFCSNLDCITYDDTTPIEVFLITNRYDLHYEVIPMLTNSQPDLISYTEKSGYLQYSTQDLKIKALTIGGKKYMSDSYFAILDED